MSRISNFKQVYVEKIYYIDNLVVLDGEVIFRTKDYLLGVAMCLAWRKNNPLEDKRRIKLTFEHL